MIYNVRKSMWFEHNGHRIGFVEVIDDAGEKRYYVGVASTDATYDALQEIARTGAKVYPKELLAFFEEPK